MTEPGSAVTYDSAAAVATITLNRPDAMNSLDGSTKDELLSAVRRAASDDNVRCLLVTGTGRAFCVGQDLREHADAVSSQPVEQVWATVAEHYAPLALEVATMAKPTVAAINGVAAGAGMSLALACDWRVAADTASFNTAFTAVGLSCDTGMSWSLPRLVGRGRALELLLWPRTVKADEALDIGLVNWVFPADRLGEEAADIANRLAAGPTRAYGAVKAALAYAEAHSLADSLQFEQDMMISTGSTQDHRDAVRAFVMKEKPTFSGR